MSFAIVPSSASSRRDGIAPAPPLRLLGAALLVAGLGAAPLQNANAASALAVATLDWSSLTVSAIGAVSLEFDSAEVGTQFNDTWVETNSGSNEESSVDWNVGTRIRTESGAGDSLTTVFGYTPPAGASSAEQNELHAEAEVRTSDWDFRYAHTGTSRSGDFTVRGDGVLVLSIDYTLNIATDGNDFLGYAYARSSVFAGLNKFAGETWVSNDSSASLETPVDFWGEGFYQDVKLGSADRLVVAMIFHDGDRGSFQLGDNAYAEASGAQVAPVPIPASGWLMAIPLSLMALRRRRA